MDFQEAYDELDQSMRVLERHPIRRENDSLNELFHHNTKLEEHRFKPTLSQAYLGGGPNFQEVVTKRYPAKPVVELPDPSYARDIGVKEAIQSRRSTNVFADRPIDKATLSDLLHYSYGVTGQDQTGVKDFRAAPSAGARYPLEIYPVVFRGDDLEPGLYHYYPDHHHLELLSPGDHRETLDPLFVDQDWVTDAAVVFLITAIFPRTVSKYGARGYRMVHMDAGHLGQNLYLMSEAHGLACNAVAGWYDDKLNDFLSVDGRDEAMVYSLVVGPKEGV